MSFSVQQLTGILRQQSTNKNELFSSVAYQYTPTAVYEQKWVFQLSSLPIYIYGNNQSKLRQQSLNKRVAFQLSSLPVSVTRCELFTRSSQRKPSSHEKPCLCGSSRTMLLRLMSSGWPGRHVWVTYKLYKFCAELCNIPRIPGGQVRGGGNRKRDYTQQWGRPGGTFSKHTLSSPFSSVTVRRALQQQQKPNKPIYNEMVRYADSKRVGRTDFYVVYFFVSWCFEPSQPLRG